MTSIILRDLKMLQYERIDISEGIDFDKSNKSVIIGISKILDLNINHMFVMDVMIFQ